ncbi:hypothetical protein NPIL_437011 [Nephila pilipes]|uniref:Uncharacterized protein n=1 Tax=Nephila pilipes TaxID=299642 RepID=A0A8X6R2P0_NEPPI|nr:hypothetical protein NPIL_437011 [Nephila pilipes]
MTYLPIVHISIPFPAKRKTFPSLIRIDDWNKLSPLSTDWMGCQMTVNKRPTCPVPDRCSRVRTSLIVLWTAQGKNVAPGAVFCRIMGKCVWINGKSYSGKRNPEFRNS